MERIEFSKLVADGIPQLPELEKLENAEAAFSEAKSRLKAEMDKAAEALPNYEAELAEARKNGDVDKIVALSKAKPSKGEYWQLKESYEAFCRQSAHTSADIMEAWARTRPPLDAAVEKATNAYEKAIISMWDTYFELHAVELARRNVAGRFDSYVSLNERHAKHPNATLGHTNSIKLFPQIHHADAEKDKRYKYEK